MPAHATISRALFVSLLLTAPTADAQDESPRECYDAVVSARLVKQIPSVFPDCGGDCIVMVWPWFIDLDVKRVISGDVPKGRLSVLAMMHTNYAGQGPKTRNWYLRRKSLGGWNLLRFANEEGYQQCAASAPPAQAILRPGLGKTLDDLRHEAEQVQESTKRN